MLVFQKGQAEAYGKKIKETIITCQDDQYLKAHDPKKSDQSAPTSAKNKKWDKKLYAKHDGTGKFLEPKR